jgi:hypothetical protein
MQKNTKTPILIDYDDTLLPTTYLEESGITLNSKIDSKIKKKLDDLDLQVVQFLNNCYEYGNPIILTNAEKDWVLFSCKKYMPNAYKIISKMEIHSARERFSKTHKDPQDWKKNLLLQDLNSTLCKSNFVISIGDSEYERYALIHFCQKNHKVGSKNILINADVSSLESTTLFIKLINTILKHIITFKHGIDYIIGLTKHKNITRTSRNSQRGNNKI